jgi:hypothetical protein
MVRWFAAAGVALGTIVLAAAGVGDDASSAPGDSTPADRPAAAAAGSRVEPVQVRLREGTRLTDRLGHFRYSGEVLNFIDENGRELGGLSNLNLERVLRMLKTVDEPESVKWSVSGVVTEFSGRNYLLITRAVYKAAAPATPEVLEESATSPSEAAATPEGGSATPAVAPAPAAAPPAEKPAAPEQPPH